MKMLEYPCAMADETARPRAADLPRPRGAVRVTVEESVFSSRADINVKRASAWNHMSSVLRWSKWTYLIDSLCQLDQILLEVIISQTIF